MSFRRWLSARGAVPTGATGDRAASPGGPEPVPDATPDAPRLAAIPGGAGRQRSAAPATGEHARPAGDAEEVGVVLDALGRLVTSLARDAFDLPGRSADASAAALQRWQRHATLGVPVAEGPGPALPLRERDWVGLTRAITEHRRDEAQFVTTAVPELREALWACVAAFDEAGRAERLAVRVMDAQLARARAALAARPPQAGDPEVVEALAIVEEALRARQAQGQLRAQAIGRRLERIGRRFDAPADEESTDLLTGLGNRSHFTAMAQRAIHQHSFTRQPLLLVRLSLDAPGGASRVVMGQRAVDRVLCEVAAALTSVFARQDDLACRLRTADFAVLLPDTEAPDAEPLAHRLLEALASRPAPTASLVEAIAIGIARHDGEERLDDWLARADQAVQRARQGGAPRIAVADTASPLA
jgi:diguanylate cyclase (GGDEF)-like protein